MRVRLMGLLQRLLPIAGLWLALTGTAVAAPADGAAGAELAARVSHAFEGGSLSELFPSDRKIAVSLDRIADLRGFVGAGPLVEALRRYLGSRSEVSFTAAPAGEGRARAVRIKGTLSSRDGSGRRERVGLVLSFERIGEAWLAVEVRETG